MKAFHISMDTQVTVLRVIRGEHGPQSMNTHGPMSIREALDRHLLDSGSGTVSCHVEMTAEAQAKIGCAYREVSFRDGAPMGHDLDAADREMIALGEMSAPSYQAK